ncbi:MarR family winged helix-turn-helix transcriptional regulator [Paenibacillus alvei]|uniref:MarR family winged helix-turn-helix transcriptional regulator n=1 Tax=Paenibacillus alvei TaxID=44250 RepID=UPI00227F5AAB|nr:MarR family transcriptional regulator [Paenibacillus alvei]
MTEHNTCDFEKEFTMLQCKLVAEHNRFNVEGITSAQYNILDLLATNGAKTTRELADSIHTTLSAISKLTKKLIDKNMITQTRDTQDRRYMYHEITEQGHAFLQKAAYSRHGVMNRIRDGLSEDELQQLASLCGKINQSLTENME